MVTLRAARPDDVEAIAAVWHQGWRDGHVGNVPDALLPHRDRESFRRRVPERLAGTTLAVLAGKVVGFVVVADDELEQLFVEASARGSGVAVALIRHGERVIAQRFERAWLAVSTGNTRARRFYEREGWSDAGAFDYAAQIAGGTIAVSCHRYEKQLTVAPGAVARRPRVLVWLANAVPAFQPTAQQLAALSAQVASRSGHELVSVSSEPEFLAELPLADAAVVWRFASTWYAVAPRLGHLFTPSAGREPFEADPSGRVALHFGRFHGALMAESLLGMISFMNLGLGTALAAQVERRWDRSPYSPRRRLAGQVALIIGFGAIGQHCARVLAGLGMVVHGLRRRAAPPSPPAARLFTADERLDAVALADHVVCILPGDTDTDHFVDAAALAAMKPSAVVYNLGRGNAVDAEALRAALVEGRIAGAFLDVLPEEPLPASSPLWATRNLYLTPHASAINASYLDLYFDELAAELAALEPG